MATEEYLVKKNTINGEIFLSELEQRTSYVLKTLTVTKSTGVSVECPIGSDARVYVGTDQYNALKKDLLDKKKVVISYTSTPCPAPPTAPSYERINGFTHYTIP